jgi:hypothetical protein
VTYASHVHSSPQLSPLPILLGIKNSRQRLGCRVWHWGRGSRVTLLLMGLAPRVQSCRCTEFVRLFHAKTQLPSLVVEWIPSCLYANRIVLDVKANSTVQESTDKTWVKPSRRCSVLQTPRLHRRGQETAVSDFIPAIRSYQNTSTSAVRAGNVGGFSAVFASRQGAIISAGKRTSFRGFASLGSTSWLSKEVER